MTFDAMSNNRIREIVVRRVRLREDLKPIKAYWHPGSDQPDWLFITHVMGQKGYESFELQSVKVWSTACQPAKAGMTGYAPCESLRIAQDEAHAALGVEYVEWEPCKVEITNPDGSIDWGRALPCAYA
jgi:hypothetical protein